MATSKLNLTNVLKNPATPAAVKSTFQYNPSTPTINPLAAVKVPSAPSAAVPQNMQMAQTPSQPSQLMNAPQMPSGGAPSPAVLSPSQLMNAPQMPGGNLALNAVNSTNAVNPTNAINPANNGPTPQQLMNAPRMPINQQPANNGPNPSQLMNAPQMPGGNTALNAINSPPPLNLGNPQGGYGQTVSAPPAPLNLGNPQGGYGQTVSAPPALPATQSVEQQALGGGGNAQQVQNFMQALQGVGAGSNNTFQNAPTNNPQTQTAAPLYANTSQQPSNASTNNNVQGYYNNGTGNMQQSSSNNWNAGGQVSQGQMNGSSNVNVGQQNMNNNVSTASNSASGWQPNNAPSQQSSSSSSSSSPSQLNANSQFSGASAFANPLAQPQMAQGGAFGGYRPSVLQTSPSQLSGQQAFAGASTANNVLGNMNQNTSQVNPQQMMNSNNQQIMNSSANNVMQNNNTQSQGGAFGGVQRPQLTPSQLGSQVNSGGAQLGSLVSDEKAKTNIMPANNLNEFLSHLTANSYTYKNKEHGEGTFVSPMAQDLEKSKLGKTMVETRPDGLKQVNYGRGFGIITAAQALMHQRLSHIEKALKIKG